MRAALRSAEGRIGLAGLGLMTFIALFGPLLAPDSATAPVAAPISPPGSGHLLGTDLLGRDVLSRIMHGGTNLLVVTTGATAAAYLLGTALGLLAGYNRGRLDGVLMRSLDVVLAFPPILLLLVLAAGAGTGMKTIVPGVILVNVPGIARIVRSATLELVGRAYVEAAVLRGESIATILRREILPNISGVLLADAGPRLSGSIILVAGLNYLGIGVDPPAPDWGAMIFENRGGMTVQPWAVAGPAIVVIAVVIFASLLGDAFARASGRSVLDHPPAA
jgi:ABC-type dipeptide/oligopeptide/nickel transport system permease subunit